MRFGSLRKEEWDRLAGKDRSLARSRLAWTPGKKSFGYRAGLCQGSLEPVPALVRGHYLGRRTTGTTLLSALTLLNPYLAKDAQYFLSTHIPFFREHASSPPRPSAYKGLIANPNWISDYNSLSGPQLATRFAKIFVQIFLWKAEMNSWPTQ